jgi:aminoglycoside 3-N-acetyltransferase
MSETTARVSALQLIKRQIKKTLRMITRPWLSGEKIITSLRALGVRPGGVLLVHSSLSSLGYVPGGSRTVIDALRRAVGPTGTLVLPTHSWDEMESGGRVFDARRTKSCVGQLTEEFRQMAGVERSLHPTHSVAAVGPRAVDLTRDHDRSSTPCGPSSPYARILEADGQILFLGVDLDSNTAYHTIEAIAGLSYLLKPAPDEFEIVDARGVSRKLRVWRHEAGIARRFREWEDLLVKRGIARTGSVGSARLLLLEGRPFLETMTELIREDPRMLLPAR